MRHYYKVGIRKEYFPPEFHPIDFTSYYRIWKILAQNREEAAKIVWDKYKNEILPFILPHLTRVCLEVNDPSCHTNTIGRGQPIQVWELSAREKARIKQIKKGNHPNQTKATIEVEEDFGYYTTGVLYRQLLNQKLEMMANEDANSP